MSLKKCFCSYRRVICATDLATMSIRTRFNQKGFKTSNLEQLLCKACQEQCFKEELDSVCTFFHDDFDKKALETQLLTLKQLYFSVHGKEKPNTENVKTALLIIIVYPHLKEVL